METYKLLIWASVFVLATGLVACGDDDDDDENGEDTETETETEMVAPCDVAAVEVSPETADDLSTVVTVDSACLVDDGWVVIHEDAAGAFGPPIGASNVLSAGEHMNIPTFLSRPAVDGETLWAMLHVDTGDLGVLDFPANDPPVLDDEGNAIVEPFVVTVPAGTPAVRLTTNAIGVESYDFTSAEPAIYADVIGSETGDQTLDLVLDWRYEIVNEVPTVHPFEIILEGSSPPGDDSILLSQSAAGTLEGDSGIDWFDDGDQVIRFTATSTLDDPALGYRCSVHSAAMRGAIDL